MQTLKHPKQEKELKVQKIIMILIVTSTKDNASINIREQLLIHYDFTQSSEKFQENPIYNSSIFGYDLTLISLNEELIYTQQITDNFDPQLIIYISRHSSRSGTPTLSVHTPGNIFTAEKGGLPKRVSIAPANALKAALIELVHQREILCPEYQVSYECTHHGPSLDVPTMFVELGSSPKQWQDMKAAEAVAHSAMTSIKGHKPVITDLGIGGPHYNAKFTKMALEGKSVFGHIIPKYLISRINTEIIMYCAEQTFGKVEKVILDWKGIKGGDKEGLMKALQDTKLEFQKV